MNCDCKYCHPWMMAADNFTAQNQIRKFNPDSTIHSSGEPVIECDPSLHDTTSKEEDVQDFIDYPTYSSESEVVHSSVTEDVYIPILDDEKDNLPDPRLELIDKQFNLKMKELFSQASSGQLVPYTIEATLHQTANDMLQYLATSHSLTWISRVKTSSSEDELPIWMSTMENNIDVLVTQFQQQMYTGFSKMMIEIGKLYHK